MRTPLVQGALRELLGSPFAVFFGAGLSIHSGLPSAHSLIARVISTFPLAVREREELLEIVTTRLPFEAFIETLQQNTDIDPLLDVFAGSKPNRNHRLIAQLMVTERVRTACTTNFDDLLEQALATAGWAPGSDYQLLSDADSFAAVDWDSAAPKVVKVHGSIDNRADVAITLRQVASQQIFAPRKRAVEHVFNSGPHERVLVLGYSCSDVFDISPHIESLPPSKHILFVEHDRKVPALEPLRAKQLKNPFRGHQGTRLRADTDSVISDLADAAGIALAEVESLAPRRSVEECVGSWLAAIEAHHRDVALTYIAGSLYMQLSRWGEALRSCERALEEAHGQVSDALEGRLLADTAVAHRHLGNFDAAIEADTKALEIARAAHDKGSEAGCLGNLSQSYLETGELQKALQSGLESLDVYRRLNDEPGLARQLGTLGSIYFHRQELSQSDDCHRESLEICRRCGFKNWEANQLGGLGKVHLRRRDFAKAISYFESAIKIAEATGNQHILVNQLNDLSIALTQQASTREADNHG